MTEILRNFRGNALAVTGGRMNMQANGGASGVSYVHSLSIGGSATLDLNDNDLVVQYGTAASPFSTIASEVVAGLSGDSGAIISTTGRAAGNTIHYFIDNGQVGLTEWPLGSGVSIDANSVILKYTYFGDVNFDGKVNDSDYAVLDGNYGSTPDPRVAILMGDANVSGTVDDSDYAVLDGNYGNGVGNPLSPAAMQVVPEPGGVGLLLAAGSIIGQRRRTRQAVAIIRRARGG
jgi:hypothetical protein